jgi:repressor LexA
VFGHISFGIRSGHQILERTMPLTRRQKQVLEYLERHILQHGYAPSFEEIAEEFSFRSLATVHEHLTNLERKGYIRRDHHASRAIELKPQPGQSGATELPLLGQVAAGEPIEALSSPDTIAVPNEMLPRRGAAYVLRVRGQSMIDDHIDDGDYVVVHNRNAADNGEMVIALVEGTSATVKRYFREPGGWIRLQPANDHMQPIRVHEDNLLVQGVVVGVIRRY